MGSLIDPAHPWRGNFFAGIPVTYSDPRAYTRGSETQQAESAPSLNKPLPAQVALVAERCATFGPDAGVARRALQEGAITCVVEVGDRNHHGEADCAVRRGYTLDYAFSPGVAKTAVASTDRDCMQVRPDVNSHMLDSLETSSSVEAFAKLADIKLPRMLGPGQMGGGVVAPNPISGTGPAQQPLVNQFEEMRGVLAQATRGADYGLRLFSLARVVAHATAVEMQGLKHTQTLGGGSCATMLTAASVLLSSADLSANVFAYVNNDVSARMRAFLLLGLRGLGGYVEPGCTTHYSAIAAEPEAEQGAQVVFVHKMGTITRADPGAPAMLEVLNSPRYCVSAYFAYAASVGVGEEASAVLLQTLLMPFMFISEIHLPYRVNRPKLDAATYLLSSVSHVPRVQLVDVEGALRYAPILAEGLQAAIGACIVTFQVKRTLDSAGYVSHIIASLAQPHNSLAVLRDIEHSFLGADVGLAWLDPFREGALAASTRAIAAYRDKLWLLTHAAHAPVALLRPLFSTGLDMRHAVFGEKNIHGQQILCLIAMQQAAGKSASAYSDRLTQQSVSGMDDMTYIRKWQCVMTWNRYGVPTGISKDSNRSPQSTEKSSDSATNPVSYQQPAVPATLTAKTELGSVVTVETRSPEQEKPAPHWDMARNRWSDEPGNPKAPLPFTAQMLQRGGCNPAPFSLGPRQNHAAQQQADGSSVASGVAAKVATLNQRAASASSSGDSSPQRSAPSPARARVGSPRADSSSEASSDSEPDTVRATSHQATAPRGRPPQASTEYPPLPAPRKDSAQAATLRPPAQGKATSSPPPPTPAVEPPAAPRFVNPQARNPPPQSPSKRSVKPSSVVGGVKKVKPGSRPL